MSDYETILVERDGEGVTTVTLNRPDKRNAMNPPLHAEMLDALTRLEGDEETRVLVITGAGSAFSSGMDLKEYFHDIADQEHQRHLNRRISNEWSERILRMFAKPTIAMVNGHCFGGAFTIVASCDFAIAADEATFGLSEVNWGGLPAGMVAKVIGTLMPYREALYYAMTAEPFDGRRAAEIGFVNRSVPLAELGAEVTALARRLSALDGAALRSTKEAFKQAYDMSHEQAFWFLRAKSEELRGRQRARGTEGRGIERFLAKEYRPGLDSYTASDAPERAPEAGPD
jgi:trans-feruloyl-CoA hydratase/vanillin synthase